MGLSKNVRECILKRSGYACEMCGACDGDLDEYHPGRKVRLHVSGLIARMKGWSDRPSNLRVLCSMCYRGVRQLTPEIDSQSSLLYQVRLASHNDRLKIWEWLKANPPESEHMISGW